MADQTTIHVAPTPELLARLDAWRETQPVQPSRNAAAIYLLSLGLDAAAELASSLKRARR